jgi:cbb3-type cytochrome oxidase subunit 3
MTKNKNVKCFTGTLTLIFVGCWWFLVFSSPKNHPRISSAERNLILKHVPEDTQADRRKKVNTWKN